MQPSVTIPTTPPEHPAMDYASLRSEGIRLLERLGGQVWTDFNAHDPGITILEQLCYAITDLGYRINYDIKDLLAGGDEDPYRSLYSPAQILTINPVTLTDLRKLLMDVAGVKNAWIEPVTDLDPALFYDPSELALYLEGSAPQPPHRQRVGMRGLYRILLETDEALGLHPADILPEVNRRLHACRSLGEDFLPPDILDRPRGEGVIVQAKIEIGSVEDPERLLAEIYNTLANTISPRIHFYTLSEMLAQGKSIDEIFDGPALDHGFIDNNELEQFQRKMGLRTSDLLQKIMDVNGVTAISTIRLAIGTQVEDWYLKLNPKNAPFLDIDKSLFDVKGPTIALMRGGIQVQLNPVRVKEHIQRLQQTIRHELLPAFERDVQLVAGKDRKVGQYYSFQHQFPALYGIGSIGLPESASVERVAQSKQLKAYLMFFDQLLANYFAQLGNAKELFSFYNLEARTYFSQAINDPTLGLDEIRSGVIPAEADDTSPAGRKNRFLNHLLARFAEEFTDYSLLQYAHLTKNDPKNDPIKYKSDFLQDYIAIGAKRGTAFDYSQPAWDSNNISGLEKRISRKLGISSDGRQALAGLDESAQGGFHVLEHVLLRPRQADKEQNTQPSATAWQTAYLAQPINKDPYSHQISFIFPSWLERFNRAGFRELIERTLREETPAHLHIYIHWLNVAQMRIFETALKTSLAAAIAGRLWDPINFQASDASLMAQLTLRDARDQMIQLLGIGIPYPLRDLKLDYVPTVAYNQAASIQILGGQVGVRYQLCDEDGNAILDGTKSFEVLPQSGQASDAIFLATPNIVKDITFTILAIRETDDKKIRLEAYLNQSVAIKAGIDTKLPVNFQGVGAQIVTNYGDKVTVIVGKTQEGISYKLVSGEQDLSTAVKGNKNDITLVSTAGFMEDTVINVLAYRTRTTNKKISASAQLETNLSILVRPNPALTITVDKFIVDYQGSVTLTIAAPQTSVEYRIYRRDLALAEYLADGTANALTVRTDEGRNIAIRIPAAVTEWGAPSGFVALDVFKTSNGPLTATTDKLLEDTLLIVQATKIENRQQLQLTQTIAVLVRPNPGPAVSVAQAAVTAGASGLVQVTGTQKGVRYQLRLDPSNAPINPPGYHQTDRNIETTRLEVDFVVEGQGKPVLLLPAGAISQASTFNILAIKNITGLSAQLTGKATIELVV